MPINHLLKKSVFAPEEIKDLIAAYREIIRAQSISKTLAETIARRVLVAGETGERDPARIIERVAADLPLPKRQNLRQRRAIARRSRAAPYARD